MVIVYTNLNSQQLYFNKVQKGFKKVLRASVQQAQSKKASQQEKFQLFSPSKINLFLRVERKREDGYHDLASLFHVIDLGDDMSFSPLPSSATSDTLTCSEPSVPTDGSNLVIKALDLYRRKAGVKQFFEMHLEKRVPHGAGMGGGSGNAATTLQAINQFFGNKVSDLDLLNWSGDIGSDISIFFSKGVAYCTGRGECVQEIEPPLSLDIPLLLVKPPVGLSTPQIFKNLDLNRRSKVDPLDLLKSIQQSKQLTQDTVVNDLEQPAFDVLPELGKLKETLLKEEQFKVVFMTGSGSTMVGVGSDTIPDVLKQKEYKDLFISPSRLMTRQHGQWYSKQKQA